MSIARLHSCACVLEMCWSLSSQSVSLLSNNRLLGPRYTHETSLFYCTRCPNSFSSCVMFTHLIQIKAKCTCAFINREVEPTSIPPHDQQHEVSQTLWFMMVQEPTYTSIGGKSQRCTIGVIVVTSKILPRLWQGTSLLHIQYLLRHQKCQLKGNVL